MVTATRTATGYRVLHGRTLSASATSAPELRDSGALYPIQVAERVAPGYAKAKVGLNLPYLRDDAWNWERYIAHDDYVAIVSDDARVERDVLFAGWISDVDVGWGAAGEQVIATAVGHAYRLRTGQQVVGRVMAANSTQIRYYNGLPCRFNAGGRPNRADSTYKSGELAIDYPPGTANPARIRVFTYDGDPSAEWWTPGSALRYLLWLYNSPQAWLDNPDISGSAESGEPLVVDVDGMDLWTALATVADAAGYDVAERYSAKPGGLPGAEIVITKRGGGTAVTVKRQDINADGTFGQVDLDRTNLFAASVAESSASCITRPAVLGGRTLVEITVQLGRAWVPSELSLPSSDPKADYGILLHNGHQAAQKTDFIGKYHMRGADFAAYAETGRLWDANTDRAYSAAPYSLSVPDVAALADYAAGTFPEMPYEPRPMITRLGGNRTSHGCYLEVSIDGGSNWYYMLGFRPLRDRLGVYLNAANLGGYVVPGGDARLAADTLFYHLATDGGNVKMRLTCTVAVPYRSAACPARRATAGTRFDTVRVFDRGTAGQVRRRASGSRFYYSGGGTMLPADESDGGQELAKIAAAIQTSEEDRLIEANLPIEWPDEDIRLTDVVTRIDGIGYALGTNAGPARRYPRVVGITRLLTPDTYSMSLILDTYRKAGIV